MNGYNGQLFILNKQEKRSRLTASFQPAWRAWLLVGLKPTIIESGFQIINIRGIEAVILGGHENYMVPPALVRKVLTGSSFQVPGLSHIHLFIRQEKENPVPLAVRLFDKVINGLAGG